MAYDEEEISALIDELGNTVVGKNFDNAVFCLSYVLGTLLYHKPASSVFFFKGVNNGIDNALDKDEHDIMMGECGGTA